MSSKLRVTAASIAEHLGISKSTVTHVLNGRAQSQRIAPETQARVQQAAQELGYRPNAIARAMGLGRFNSVALLQDLQSINAALVFSVGRELQRRENHMVVADLSPVENGGSNELPRIMREVSVDGFLINAEDGCTSGFMEQVKKLSTPTVWLHRPAPVNAVYVDDELTGALATEHLLALGHRQITLVQSRLGQPSSPCRSQRQQQGYLQVLEGSGITPRIALAESQSGGQQGHGSSAAIEQALTIHQRPTALIIDDISLVPEVFATALQLRLRIPQDVSVVCIGGELATPERAHLTSVGANTDDLGRTAVEMLLQCVDNPGARITSKVIRPTLFSDSTTARPGGRLDLLPIGKNLQF